MKNADHIHTNDNPWGSDKPRQKSQKDRGSKNNNVDYIFSRGGGSGGGNGDMPFNMPQKNIIWIAIVGLIGIWLISGFYQVNPDEEGLVLRFGKWEKTTQPGWHYHLPYPIERVLKPKVTATNQIEIGFTNKDESLMLTGDRNIVDVSVIVQWRIKNARDFLFNIRDTRHTIKAVTESVIREIMGQTPIDVTFAEGRADIQSQAKERVQQILDHYQSGVQITEVNLKEVNPPQSVIDSFRDVDRAYAQQESKINEAETVRNKVVPQARGESAKILEQAIAYKNAVIAKAQGEVAQFKAVLKEYEANPGIIKKQMYFDTMEKVLQKAHKVILNGDAAKGVLPHMKLPALTTK